MILKSTSPTVLIPFQEGIYCLTFRGSLSIVVELGKDRNSGSTLTELVTVRVLRVGFLEGPDRLFHFRGDEPFLICHQL